MDVRDILSPLINGPDDQKALTAADYRVAVPDLAGPAAMRRRLSSRTASRHLNAYAGSEDAIDWVMDCAWLIAETAGGAEFHFERNGRKLVTGSLDKQPDDVEAAPQDLVRLLTQPNPYMDWEELLELAVIDFLLAGDFYWLKFRPDVEAGKPLALYRLAPPLVGVEENANGVIDHYTYTVKGAEPMKLRPEHVLHGRRPNPHDPHFGAGVVAGAPRMFDLELFLTESQTQYYEQGTRLSGVLTTDKNVGEPLFNRLMQRFYNLYSGRRNAHKVAVLERGLKFDPIQGTAQEAEYRIASEFSRDRILASFRVPPSMLGLPPASSASTGPKEEERKFDNKTMRPFLRKFAKVVSHGLTQAWGVDLVFDYEYTLPQEDRFELAGTVATLPGVRVREVRTTAGFDPLGPEAKLPDGRLIDDVVLNLPGDNSNRSRVKDRPLPGEPGRTPNPENTDSFPQDAEATPSG